VGFFALAEYEWFTCLDRCIPVDKIEYEDYTKCAKKCCKQLKEEFNCDIIVALTHMRIENDRILSQNVGEIDFILGGHDHLSIGEISDKGVFIVKSGTDFEEFGNLEVYLNVTENEAEKLKK